MDEMGRSAEAHLDDAEDMPPPSPAPAAPPRAITPRALRRSWNELPVRVWIVLLVLMALITIYFMLEKWIAGRELRALLRDGQNIHATIIEINGTKDRTIRFKRSDMLEVWLGFALPGEPNVVAEGFLSQLPDPQPVHVGDPLEIRVDPEGIIPWDKPGMKRIFKWTERNEPPPWYVEYTVVLLLLPLVAIVGLIAWWRRRGVLRVWREGQAATAHVIDRRHTALAPRSRVIRFALDGSADRRVWTTLHPADDMPAPGDVIWVIHPINNPGRAIVAKLYK